MVRRGLLFSCKPSGQHTKHYLKRTLAPRGQKRTHARGSLVRAPLSWTTTGSMLGTHSRLKPTSVMLDFRVHMLEPPRMPVHREARRARVPSYTTEPASALQRDDITIAGPTPTETGEHPRHSSAPSYDAPKAFLRRKDEARGETAKAGQTTSTSKGSTRL